MILEHILPMGDKTTPNLTSIIQNIIELNKYGALQTYLEAWISRYKITAINTNYQIKASDRILPISSAPVPGSITLTLPNSTDLTEGDFFEIIDFTKNSTTYNISLNLNGNGINGSGLFTPISTNGQVIRLIYLGNSQFTAYNLGILI